MVASSQTWQEENIEAGGLQLQVVRGGQGTPLLILHGEMGHPGWMKYHEALAGRFSLMIPSHPGFGTTPRLDWIMTVGDLAGWYHGALEDLGIDRINILAFSFGGWLASEMAAMCSHRINKLALVSPMGIKPLTGEIFDMYLVTATEFLEKSFLEPKNTPEYEVILPEEPDADQVEEWAVAREESCRLSWKPYMHNPALFHHLERVKLDTLILWGKQDAVVPVSTADIFHESIRGSQLEIIDDCGHHPELEQTDEFVRKVETFFSE